MSIDRKTKTIEVNGKDLIIKELDIKSMYKYAEKMLHFYASQDTSKENIPLHQIHALLVDLSPVLTNWSGDEILDLTPSQLKIVIPHLQEINEDFLSILDSFGVLKKIRTMKEKIKTIVEQSETSEKS